MAKPLDLIGKRFGALTVVERAENNKNNNTQWLCKCDCGKEKIVLGYDLTHGRTTSCGCKITKRGKPAPNRKDLSGQRFGTLTVLRMHSVENGRVSYICKCDCGEEVLVSGSNLRAGRNGHRSCPLARNGSLEDLTGKRFGYLTVEKEAGRDSGGVICWLCRCDCGAERVVRGPILKTGKARSCGCKTRRMAVTDPAFDGMSHLKSAYRSMMKRCSPSYHNHNTYFDKGISVCDEWLGNDGMNNFCKWAVNNGYAENLTLDRVDNERGYEPSNCRWVTNITQQNNRSNNVYIVINGEKKTMKEWSDYYGVSYGMVKMRHRNGWADEDLFKPKKH